MEVTAWNKLTARPINIATIKIGAVVVLPARAIAAKAHRPALPKIEGKPGTNN